VVEKFAGIFGPWVFARVIGITGSSRVAILAVVVFFVVGGTLLHFVDVERGQLEARAAEAGAA
jgi:UMF1 family MFS transporter